jgi:ZIP family zinc transporter
MAISAASGGLDNDTRGWIMCVVSGIACVVGASIVCVDVIVRLFPGKKSFRIQDSNVFLACSLSLSFGVMVITPFVCAYHHC